VFVAKDIKQIKLIPFEGNKDCDNRVLGYRGRKEGMGLAAVAVAVAVVVVVVRERRRKRVEGEEMRGQAAMGETYKSMSRETMRPFLNRINWITFPLELQGSI
jgi:hypothetical protein